MKIPLYLAMTAAEFAACKAFPHKIGWMACHFSPYCTGLSNIPTSLPADSLLIVNDITPIHNHDPQRIFDTLEQAVASLKCSGVLLDLQRSGYEESAVLAKKLTALPVPVAVSELYAKELSCPVFVSAPPLRKPLSEHLAPWQGRKIWLEAALGEETVTVDFQGCTSSPYSEASDFPHTDAALHCRYAICTQQEQAQFHLRRNKEDLISLLKEAEKYGVTRTVGLYQELKDFPLFNSRDL